MNQKFHNAEMEAEFAANGYVIRRIMSRQIVAELLSKIEKLRPDDAFEPDGNSVPYTYHVTELDSNIDYKKKVQGLGRAYLAGPIAERLVGYSILLTSLIVKAPSKGDFEMHSDWTVSKDPKSTAINVWCPLTDVDETNGALKMIPGSQSLLDNIVGPMIPNYYAEYQGKLRDLSTAICMEAGEAIFFYTNMLHGSGKNNSDTTRVAIRSVCVPSDPPTKFYLYTGTPSSSEELQVFEMDENTYLESDLATGQLNGRRVGTVKNQNRTLDEAQFVAAICDRRGQEPLEAARSAPLSLLRRLRAVLQC